ncbi:hypothetical protein CGRA01v4_00181 [Colletotrichum graminicola]|nr:hypothetical protein CGRA01v4_00181 [Colletotrichum graminicola]
MRLNMPQETEGDDGPSPSNLRPFFTNFPSSPHPLVFSDRGTDAFVIYRGMGDGDIGVLQLGPHRDIRPRALSECFARTSIATPDNSRLHAIPSPPDNVAARKHRDNVTPLFASLLQPPSPVFIALVTTASKFAPSLHCSWSEHDLAT